MFAIVICGGCPGTSVQGGANVLHSRDYPGTARSVKLTRLGSTPATQRQTSQLVGDSRIFADLPHGAPCRRLASSVCSYQNTRNDGVSYHRDLSICLFFKQATD